MKTSKFFAYLGRLKWIKRWGLKRNIDDENVMEHSWHVATIAHALALIHQHRFAGVIDANHVAAAALFHDAAEIITGDMPTPVKYHSATIRDAYKQIEREAEHELLQLLPDYLRPAYQPLLISEQLDAQTTAFIKAADIISAYIKCQQEVNAQNSEFESALHSTEARLRALSMPEVDEFMRLFNDGYLLTLDQLLAQHEHEIKGE